MLQFVKAMSEVHQELDTLLWLTLLNYDLHFLPSSRSSSKCRADGGLKCLMITSLATHSCDLVLFV